MDVLTRIATFTSPRGWVLIALTALGGYIVLGMLGAFAFALGAAAGLSASSDWEIDPDEGGAGTPNGHSWESPPAGRSTWCQSDARLDFSSPRRPLLRTPAFS